MHSKDHTQDNLTTPDTKLLINNIIGAFLILMISLVFTFVLLFPSLMAQFNTDISSVGTPVLLLGGVLIMGFLITVPATWFIQAIIDYRNARDLDRLGLMTKGTVVEKWEAELNGKPVYYLQYKYLTHLRATQTTDKNTYQQLQHNENVFVLYLDNLPHISRLDLD